ncbi:RAD55 family ATPase [Nitrosopumilus sp. S4]
MEKEEIISKLSESLKRDFGDYGRTIYVIEKLKKNAELPKSDQLYVERMVKSCRPEEIPTQPKKIEENISSEDLIKCYQCDLNIQLDEKSIRKNNFWFHDRCFEKIPIVKSEVSQKVVFEPKRVSPKPIVKTIEKSQIAPEIEIAPKIIKQAVRIESKTTNAQMAYSGGLLASLVGSTYLLGGEIFSSSVAVVGTGLYLVIFKSKIFPKKAKKSSIVKVGIPGFDSALSAGLKKNSSVVVSGPPGSGKTTFGLQFIYAGAKEYDEPGVYISMSQSIDEIKKDCKSFGWDVEDLISKEKILMIDLRPFKIKDEIIGKDDSLYRGEQIPFEHLTTFILNSVKKIKAKRIVIDSISILGMQYSDKFYMRQGLQGMIQSLENIDGTSLLISEFSESNQIPSEWFVTSGIIQLDNKIVDNAMKRTIKIIKLRGIEHSEKVHPLELGNDGLYIYD